LSAGFLELILPILLGNGALIGAQRSVGRKLPLSSGQIGLQSAVLRFKRS
jgi:hypothetical protein